MLEAGVSAFELEECLLRLVSFCFELQLQVLSGPTAAVDVADAEQPESRTF